MPSSLEIEVKLTGAAKALAKAWRGEALEGDPASEEVSKSLENVYFDTPDLRLRKLGYAFRIRKDGKRLVQTLKSKDVGGKAIARRREWSSVVTGLTPDVEKIGDKDIRHDIGELAPGDLVPIFTTKVRRRQRLVKRADDAGRISVIEVAFDQGEIIAGARSEPIGEIEFELQRGRPAAIHDLIADVLTQADLKIETRSKSARGYALATGKPPPWLKAPEVTLDPAMTPHQAFCKIAKGCLDHWLANEPAARDGSEPEGVHQMRVGLRRLRSALLAFDKVIAPKAHDWMVREAKWLLHQTGPARDWDVILGEILPPIIAGSQGDTKTAGLVEASEVKRFDSYKHLRDALESERYTAFVNELGAWLEAAENDGAEAGPDASESLKTFSGALLHKRHRKALKTGRDIENMTPAARHRLRIALKKLRYSVEFFQSLYGNKRAKAYLEKLKVLQDVLGHMNDVAVARALLPDLAAAQVDPEQRSDLMLAAGVAVGWYAHANQSDEFVLQDIWSDFASAKVFWRSSSKKV